MNVRMVNAVFEDRNRPEFDPQVNTNEFIARIPDYVAHGVRAFTICLQGGMPGYEGAVNSAFESDCSLRDAYIRRVRQVIEACDRNPGYDHPLLKTSEGVAELSGLAKRTCPSLLVSASGLGDGRLPDDIAQASDFLLIHFNETRIEDIPSRVAALKRFHKPIVCNEDEKVGEEGARTCEVSVANGISWGLMLVELNQHFPFTFRGAADDPKVYAALRRATSSAAAEPHTDPTTPSPDRRESAPLPSPLSRP
jgi:hypothetical protein